MRVETAKLFGCLRNGELMMLAPRYRAPIAAPSPRDAARTARWLHQVMTCCDSEYSWYGEAIVMIPLGTPDAARWNVCLQDAGFRRISSELHFELTHQLWQVALGQVASVEFSDMWLLVRPSMIPSTD